jgi:hypothetical protein
MPEHPAIADLGRISSPPRTPRVGPVTLDRELDQDDHRRPPPGRPLRGAKAAARQACPQVRWRGPASARDTSQRTKGP